MAEVKGPAGGGTPRVSVGMPVYNGAPMLDTAIRGILAQTFTDFELIISDNGSTDETAEICARYADDPRVRYVRQPENLGPSANFRYVLDVARAPYFMWAAHDDLREPQALELLTAALDADPGAVMASSAFQIIGPDGEPVKRSRPWGEVFSKGPFWQFAYLIASDEEKSIHIYGLFRREAIARAMADMAYVHVYSGNDICTMMHVLGQGRAAYVDQVLFHYRVRGGGAPAARAVPALERVPGLLVQGVKGFRYYSDVYLTGNTEMFAGLRDVVRTHTRFGAVQRAALVALARTSQAVRGTRIVSRVVRGRLLGAG